MHTCSHIVIGLNFCFEYLSVFFVCANQFSLFWLWHLLLLVHIHILANISHASCPFIWHWRSTSTKNKAHSIVIETDDTEDIKTALPWFAQFTDKESQQCNVLHKPGTMLFEAEAMGTVLPGLPTCARHGPDSGERAFLLRSKLVRIRILRWSDQTFAKR